MDEKVNIFIAFMLPQKALSEMAKVADNVKELFQPDGKDEKFFHCTLLCSLSAESAGSMFRPFKKK